MMSLPRYYLEKPDFSDLNQQETIARLQTLGDAFRDLFESANTPSYLYWDKLKYKINLNDLSPEQAWFLVRQFRNIVSSQTLIKAEQGDFFRWIRLPYTDELLHRIDMLPGQQISSINKQQFIVHGIIEEAIASSQLEGAHTTRSAAKKMILEKRIPQTESEQMILNNYRTIMGIEEEYKNQDLSLDLIFELHKKLTEATNIPKEEQGRLRNDNDPIDVRGYISTEQYITHIPPKESFLKEQINRLIAFANDKEGGKFIHPIIKAIFLHFWIGYLHPFTDGNGRMARALFYWYLLKKGYWTMIYLPISTVIKKAPVQYAMAYIYSEQDNLDLTYFYDFHIKKIIESLNQFELYIEKKLKENHKLNETLGREMILNDRQKRLLHYLLSDQNSSVTVTSHGEINNISRQTAAKDLKELESNDFLIPKREGKFIRYYPSEKLINFRDKI